MKKLVHSRLAVTSLLVGGAMIALVAYVSVFAAPPPGTIQACYNDTNGNLRLVNSPSDCRAHENPISWSVAGLPGPPGPAGSQGPAGPPGPAGTGANVTTFRHTRTVGNVCGPASTDFTYIDNPATNGNPNATIFVTAIVGINGGGTGTNPNQNWYLTYTGASGFGTCPADRWIIAGGDISVGGQFNVMLVGP